jgi:hypothetical protein
MQAGSHRVTYSVHTAPGADPGGRTKDNQVGAKDWWLLVTWCRVCV